MTNGNEGREMPPGLIDRTKVTIAAVYCILSVINKNINIPCVKSKYLGQIIFCISYIILTTSQLPWVPKIVKTNKYGTFCAVTVGRDKADGLLQINQARRGKLWDCGYPPCMRLIFILDNGINHDTSVVSL